MYSKILMFLIAFVICISANAQVVLKVYHGSNGESQVYDNDNKVVSNPKIKMRQGELVEVQVINSNPIFYKYTLKYETIELESESKEITNLLITLNSIIAARTGSVAALSTTTSETDKYKNAINLLIKDINTAKEIIRKSDHPESPDDALKFNRNGGLRFALLEMNSMSSEQYRFNNSSLLNDLNLLSDKASLDDVEKQSFTLLNSSLVDKVNEIKKQVNTQTIWKNTIKVTDTIMKISLDIAKIDKSNNSLQRDGCCEQEFILNLGTIVPYYKRAVLELVPVANFIFAQDVREFYLEEGIVQSRESANATIAAGVILNVNVSNFGQYKEMSVGIGPGYKFNKDGDALENIYFSGLFSYKNFLRMGVGFGFAQFPSEQLKDGGKVGEPLPSNISNLDDILNYEEKPSVFLSLSFTGLNLTKKK